MTAPLRGPGFAKLRQLADVVYDPWITELEQTPLRIYSAEQLAERITAEAADVVVVESDSVRGPVFDLGLRAIASTRGDPNNVDIDGATAAGIPVLNTPARNADAVAEIAVAPSMSTLFGSPRVDAIARRPRSNTGPRTESLSTTTRSAASAAIRSASCSAP